MFRQQQREHNQKKVFTVKQEADCRYNSHNSFRQKPYGRGAVAPKCGCSKLNEWMNRGDFSHPTPLLAHFGGAHRTSTTPPRLVIKWLIVELASDNGGLCSFYRMFSISSLAIPASLVHHGELAKERQRRKKEGRRRKRRRALWRKSLDGDDGKFGECGPIFKSGCQATDEQQRREGWRPHWTY